MAFTNTTNLVQDKIRVTGEDTITSTAGSEIHCRKEVFTASQKIEIDGINDVKGSAYWKAGQVELHGSTNTIGKDLYISADRVVFDHANVQARTIYLVENAEIINDGSNIVGTFEYLTVENMSAEWDWITA